MAILESTTLAALAIASGGLCVFITALMVVVSEVNKCHSVSDVTRC